MKKTKDLNSQKRDRVLRLIQVDAERKRERDRKEEGATSDKRKITLRERRVMNQNRGTSRGEDKKRFTTVETANLERREVKGGARKTWNKDLQCQREKT